METPRFMMMLLACTALLTFTQCSDDPSPAKPADVYIAGNFNTLEEEGGYNWIPGYWKNGEFVALSESAGDSELIAVHNGDVYVIGTLNEEGNKKIIWKNGVMTDFSTSMENVNAYGIEFHGDDMYVFGDRNNLATYWKNGDPQELNTIIGSVAYDILVDGEDVYVAGYENSETGYGIATIWKNNQEGTHLSDGTEYARAYGLAMLNGELYASGFDKETAMMWKDGIGTPLGTIGNSGTGYMSIAIRGNDFYIVGYDKDIATIWKNGEEGTPLPTPAGGTSTYGYTIAVDGKDMYILGEGYVDSKWPVLVWKNNELVTPYDGTNGYSAYAMSVARPN